MSPLLWGVLAYAVLGLAVSGVILCGLWASTMGTTRPGSTKRRLQNEGNLVVALCIFPIWGPLLLALLVTLAGGCLRAIRHMPEPPEDRMVFFWLGHRLVTRPADAWELMRKKRLQAQR